MPYFFALSAIVEFTCAILISDFHVSLAAIVLGTVSLAMSAFTFRG